MKSAALGLVAVTAAFVASAASAGAPVKSSYSYQAAIASADWYGRDGCILTHNSVRGWDALEDGVPGSTADVSVFRYDECSDVALINIYGSAGIADTNFVVSKNAQSAILATKIDALDYAVIPPAPVTFNINLTWSATSPPESFHYFDHRSEPPFYREMFRSVGKGRRAAVAGTVSDGQSNYATGSESNAQILERAYLNTSRFK